MVDNFDISVNWPSFGAGFAAGVAASAAGYRVWKFASSLGADDGERAIVKTAAQGQVDGAYLRALVEKAQASHLMSHTKLRLTDILIQPRFLPPPELVSMPDEDEAVLRNVWTSVPRIHDFSALHGVYNLPTISIDNLGRGDDTLILIGQPGSGRTTALLAIALWSAGFAEFKPPEDAVSRQIEEEEAELSAKDRAERVKRRVTLANRTRERFAEQSGESVETSDRPFGELDASTSRFRQVSPLYVHLANVIPTSGEYGQIIDPAEPLVRGLQNEVGWIAAKRMVGKTYDLLNAGQALVLIDGYDDLPHKDRPAIMEWLRAFINIYSDNFIIITMPPSGYGPLVEAGAVPVYMNPWNDQALVDTSGNWIKNWDKISDKPVYFDEDSYRNPDEFHTAVTRSARMMSNFDTSLFMFSAYSGVEGNECEQMKAYLHSILPKADEMMFDLQRLGRMQLDEGYITEQRLVQDALEIELARLEGREIPAMQNAPKEQPGEIEVQAEFSDEIQETVEDDPDAGLDDFFSHLDTEPERPSKIQTQAVSETTATKSADGDEQELSDTEKQAAKKQGQIQKEQRRFLDKLIKAGLLIRYRGGRYQFRHLYIASYLGAVAIAGADDATLLAKHANPDWRFAMYYLSQMRDVDVLAAQQVATDQPDILHERILELARWLRYAGPDVTWRNHLLKYLGNLLVAQNQYTLVRERIAAALLESRDEGTLVVFRRALKMPNPSIRRLACLALGVLRDDAAVDPLVQIALEDPDPDNQICAALALTAIDTDAALESMAFLLQENNDRNVRRALTESLAANREEGYLTLFETLKADEIMLRRAAIFGIGRIQTDWALIALNEIYLEDTEEYVRLAAEAVLGDMQKASLQGVHAYPPPYEIPWIEDWKVQQIEYDNLPYNAEGMSVFVAAFDQQDYPLMRLMTTIAMGQMGLVENVSGVYGALRDREAEIRDAAYRTLGEFQHRLGKPLPAP